MFTMHSTTPHSKKIIQPKRSLVLRLREAVLWEIHLEAIRSLVIFGHCVSFLWLLLQIAIILHDIKEYNFVVLWFCKAEACHGSHWAKIKVLGGLYSFVDFLVESVSLPFLVFRSYPYSLVSSFFHLSSKPAMLHLFPRCS
jgi:hypothetical protein